MEKDWTLFKKKLGGWQEAYMDKLVEEYKSILNWIKIQFQCEFNMNMWEYSKISHINIDDIIMQIKQIRKSQIYLLNIFWI